MTGLLQAIENTAFSTWIRESGSIWSYPFVLFLHTIGLAFLVGPDLVIDLRLLGAVPQLPLAPLARFYGVMWAGFWTAAVSGAVLLAADATTKLATPVFYVKMALVVLAVVNMMAARRRVFGMRGATAQPTGRAARLHAAASIACWTAVIVAGRLMAYLGPVSGAPGLRNSIP